MAQRNRLNVKQIAALKKPGVYADGGGLYVRVRAKSLTRSWLYIYTLNGKRHEIGLGSLYDFDLAKARAKATELRSMLLEGRDPAEERKRKVVAAKPKPAFGPFAMQLIDGIETGFRNEKHRAQWRSSINTYAASILDRPIDTIAVDDMLRILKPIWLAKHETATRVRQRIERILDAATVQGWRSGDNPARLKGNLDLLLPRRPKGEDSHHAALPFDELPDFIIKLNKQAGIAADALKFLILTAARTDEVLGMTWQEVDWEQNIWSVPPGRMKAGRQHDVPLSDTAMAILRSIKPKVAEPDAFVFTSKGGRPLSNMAMAQLLKRMDIKVTVHGFRSTFRDWAGETTGFAREDIEMALAHTIANKTERAYRRGNALAKRREVMAAWAAFGILGLK